MVQRTFITRIVAVFAVMTLVLLGQADAADPVCSKKECTSPNGKGGKDCWAGNGEAFSCNAGYKAKLTGKTAPHAGKTWQEYSCCKSDEKPALKPAAGCYQKECTSADGKGGKDCWAGNGDPFSCTAGFKAELTGKKVPYEGKTYYEYTCCKSDKKTVTLNGYWFTWKTGTDPSQVVDRVETRMVNSNRFTSYRNGPVGTKTHVDSKTAKAMESCDIIGNKLILVEDSKITATLQSNGDLVWSHGYTSRREKNKPAATCPASLVHDKERCSSVANDCCAPNSIKEAATCRDGFKPIRTNTGCFSFGEGNYLCCGKPGTPKTKPAAACSQKECTSPNGKGGKDCWAGNGEAFSCNAGYKAKLTGKKVPHGGKTWQEYTCCKSDEKPAPKPAAGCSQKECTSPNGKGGKDCWAGNGEAFSCTAGYKAKLTGKRVPHGGKTWQEYTCCKSDAAFGSQQVVLSLIQKQIQLSARLALEHDHQTIQRILVTLHKLQDLIDRINRQ